MKLLLSLVLLTCLVAISARASQEEDAAALEAMFADARSRDGISVGQELTLDGCVATLTSGSRTFRFLVSGIDFEKTAKEKNFLSLGEDAMKRVIDWELGRSTLPRIMNGVIFGQDELSKEELEQYLSDNRIRLLSELVKIQRGEYGEWFRYHHQYIYDGRGEMRAPYFIEPIASIPAYLSLDRRQEVIQALMIYAYSNCLPAPTFD